MRVSVIIGVCVLAAIVILALLGLIHFGISFSIGK